jgi:hypothetical protein
MIAWGCVSQHTSKASANGGDAEQQHGDKGKGNPQPPACPRAEGNIESRKDEQAYAPLYATIDWPNSTLSAIWKRIPALTG